MFTRPEWGLGYITLSLGQIRGKYEHTRRLRGFLPVVHVGAGAEAGIISRVSCRCTW